METEYVFAMLTVTDLGVATEWYRRLLGRPPDLRPHEGEAAWQLTGSASLCLVEDPMGAGGGAITLVVSGLDRVLGDVSERGIPPVEARPVGDAGRKAVLRDPDGNAVSVVELAVS